MLLEHSREMGLIAACLFTDDRKFAGALEAAPTGPDWQCLMTLARLHGMLPLVSTALSGLPASSTLVPKPVLLALDEWRPLYLSHTLTLIAALMELQQEFDREQLNVVTWKGPALAAMLYGSPVLREASDLDFLLLADDLPQILLLTQRLGYTLLGQNGSPEENRYTFAHQHEFCFSRIRDNVVLEFHVQIMTSRFLFWQNTQAHIARATKITAPLAGRDFLIERSEDLLVGLCLHAFKHNWDRMKWVGDIARFLRVQGPQLDWAASIAALKQQGRHTVVLVGLATAAEVFHLELPAPVTKALQPLPAVVTLAAGIAAHMMSGSTDLLPATLQKQLIALLCPRLRDRLVYTLRPLLHLEYEDLYIPERYRMLSFVNYISRVVRLLRKYGAPRLVSKTAGSVRAAR